jgi:hypothetical protein
MELYRHDQLEGPCPSCPGRWTPDHAFACRNNSAGTTGRHDTLKRLLCAFWKQSGFPVALEYLLPEPEEGWPASDDEQRQRGGDGRRVDLRVEDQQRHTVVLYDVTFCSPRPLSRQQNPDAPVTREELELRAAALAQGRAVTRERRGAAPQMEEESSAREAAIEILVGPVLRQAEELKRRKYGAAVSQQPTAPNQDAAAPSPVTFTPLVLSSAGTATAAVNAMLRQLSDAVARQRRNDAAGLWTSPTKAAVMRGFVNVISRHLQTSAAAFFGGARSS